MGRFERLVEELHHPVEEIRISAINTLAKSGDRRAMAPLAGLLADESEGVRACAAAALERIGDPQLRQALKLSKGGKVRIRVRLPPPPQPPQTPKLLVHLLGGPKWKDAAEKLVAIEAIPYLLEAMAQEGTRERALSVLVSIADRYWVKPQVREEVLPAIIESLGEMEPELLARAADALGMSRAESAIAPLSGLAGNPNKPVRMAAVKSLANIGEPAADAMIAALESPHSDVREWVCDKLAIAKERKAVPALAKAMWDRDKRVRSSAAAALGRIGAPDLGLADFVLLLIMNRASKEVCRRGEDAVAPLVRILSIDDADLQEKALFALAKICEGAPGSPIWSETAPAIAALLGNDAAKVRKEAARLLSQSGFVNISPKDRIVCLAVLGKDSELAAMGSAGAPQLLEAARSRHADIRKSLVNALGRIIMNAETFEEAKGISDCVKCGLAGEGGGIEGYPGMKKDGVRLVRQANKQMQHLLSKEIKVDADEKSVRPPKKRPEWGIHRAGQPGQGRQKGGGGDERARQTLKNRMLH